MTTEEIEKAVKDYADSSTLDSYLLLKLDFRNGVEYANKYWQEKTKWIPIDERLPKLHPITPLYWISGYVLTLNNAGGYSVARLCKYADEEGKWAGVDCFERLSITHWKEIE